MDGREGMGFSGSAAPYYFNRAAFGVRGSGAGPVSGGAAPAPPSYKHLLNPNATLQTDNAGGGNFASTFNIQNPSHNFARGASVVEASPAKPTDPGKRKRGRPRKYMPDGAKMSLGLSHVLSTSSSGAIGPTGLKKTKGRPPGSGWKQQLAPLGEWWNSSAGLAFTPHVIRIEVGEDVAAKVLAFAQQRPRALCILSAIGSVSAVTLRLSVTSSSNVTYEGCFEILRMSGSYLVAETGGPRNRTGGLSISVYSPDGQVLGGAVGGRLIAAGPVQVVVCSFVFEGKTRLKTQSISKGKKTSTKLAEKSAAPVNAVPGQGQAPSSTMNAWPPGSRPDSRNFQTEIERG